MFTRFRSQPPTQPVEDSHLIRRLRAMLREGFDPDELLRMLDYADGRVCLYSSPEPGAEDVFAVAREAYELLAEGLALVLDGLEADDDGLLNDGLEAAEAAETALQELTCEIRRQRAADDPWLLAVA
ncbi:MAG: hypothetical protein AB1758_25590 [Candidatus Eremiobacterota bacterium]